MKQQIVHGSPTINFLIQPFIFKYARNLNLKLLLKIKIKVRKLLVFLMLPYCIIVYYLFL